MREIFTQRNLTLNVSFNQEEFYNAANPKSTNYDSETIQCRLHGQVLSDRFERLFMLRLHDQIYSMRFLFEYERDNTNCRCYRNISEATVKESKK